MIVTCERCDTQFQLDEARVPEGGARVRCSRCKHAFTVQPPAASPEEEVHRAARSALAVGETPEVTEDLSDDAAPPDASGEDGADPRADSDWQFNEGESGALDAAFGEVGPDDSLSLDLESEGPEPVPADPLAPGDAPLALEGEDAAAPALAERAEADELGGPEDELGSPEDWDIFDDVSDAAPGVRAPVAAPAPVVVPAARTPAAPATALPRVVGQPLEEPVAGAWPRRAAAAAGWLATVALLAVGGVRGLAPSAPAPVRSMEVASGVSLDALSARWVDNAALGDVLVVSGRLTHTGAAARAMPSLILVLRDARGAALAPSPSLESPRPPQVLREGLPPALSARRAGFRRPLAPGEHRNFEAIAWPLPREAVAFEIRAAGGPS